MSDSMGSTPPPVPAPAPAAAAVTLAPVAETQRFAALDVLRGFALLGILLLNIQSFAMIGAAYMNPNAYGTFEGVNRVVWHVIYLFGDQKFMSIFSMLFGAGIVLMTTRAEKAGRGSAGIHYRRMGWLILFGLLHAHLLWYGDILYTYGMCGLIVYLFRRMPPWLLILFAMCGFIIASGISILFGYSMQFWPPEAIADMAEGWLPATEVVAEELANYRGNWVEQMSHRVPNAIFFQTFLFFIGGLGFKAGGLMLLGMALYKLGVFTAARSVRFYLVMALLGFGIGIPIVEFGIRQNFAHEWSIDYSFFYGMQFNYWASVIVALGWVGLVMLVMKSVAGAATGPLAAVGRMALTNYLMQTIICTTIFYGHGFGLFGRLERIEMLGVVLAVWVVQLIWSPIWLKFFVYGPAEWLWRSLSYWKRQPLRRVDYLSA